MRAPVSLVLLFAAAFGVSTDLRAQAVGDPGPEPSERGFERGMISVRLGLGSFDPAAELSLDGLEYGPSGMLAVSVRPDATSAYAFDLEVLSVGRSYLNDFGDPIIGSIEERTSLASLLVSVGVRGLLPPTGPVHAYAGAGLGYVEHHARVKASLLLLPGTRAEEKVRDFAPYLGAGAEAAFGAWGVAVDLRRFSSDGSFGDPFFIAPVNLGGWAISVAGMWIP